MNDSRGESVVAHIETRPSAFGKPRIDGTTGIVETTASSPPTRVRIYQIGEGVTSRYNREFHMSSQSTAGVILLWGKSIRPGERLHDPTAFNVTPTVVYLLGLPVGRDMRLELV
jgi:hypothetical protein